MKSFTPALSHDAPDEVSALITTLYETDQRLEELTAGEVDAVADGDGRTFLLHRAQDRLRHHEAARQAAILDALPANVALLDARGIIVSVNTAWRTYDGARRNHSPGLGIGVNYVETCEHGQEDGDKAGRIAHGIRAVLDGSAQGFALDYPTHSATAESWYRMTVTPLADGRPDGAVVMHLDITAELQVEESLRISESRFRQMAESIRDVFFLQNLDGSKVLYVSPGYEEIWGRSCASLYARPDSWKDAIHPDDVAQALEPRAGSPDGQSSHEFRIVRPDGAIRWVQVREYPILDDAGQRYRTAGVCSDITRRKQAADDLLRSETIKSAILESSLDCMIAIDHCGRIIEFNPAAELNFGVTRDAAIGAELVELVIPPRLRDSYRAGFARYLATGEGEFLGRRLELDMMRSDGTEFPVEFAITMMPDTSPPMFTSFIRDISVRKEAEEKIRRLNRVYAILSGINALIVRVRNRDELFREVCRIAVDVGGFSTSWIGVVDQAELKIVPAAAGPTAGFMEDVEARLSLRDDAPAGHGPAATAVRSRTPVVVNDVANDARIVCKSAYAARGLRALVSLPLLVAGETVAVLDLHAAEAGYFDAEEMLLLRDLAGDIAFAIDHIGKQERLDYLAYYDSLTGLANRALFLERVAQFSRSAQAAGQELAVFVVDLERFRNINDTLGRPAGDALLRHVADWLIARVGGANLLARVGADHFAVVLPEVREDGDVTRLLEKTVAAFLEHPFPLNDGVFRVGVKVGIALFPGDGSSADTLLRNAETALKKAKTAGDRYMFYTQKMTETSAGTLSLENQLRQALEREEFVLHYQPKVNTRSRKVVGAEALIRWNDPRTGLVLPGRFVPILEETGLIHQVGRWALHQAIGDHLRWRASGRPPMRVAVNVSQLQLRHHGFVGEILQALQIDAQAAAGLELEITETLIMQDIEHGIDTLQAIRAMGVTIAIDDFGTGFSSLSYLSKLPIDTLKIDRSFVIELKGPREGHALVSTIINLAHSLKLGVVAEGVETAEQSRLLGALDCDEMQGFLFSKAVPCDVFEQRFLANPVPW